MCLPSKVTKIKSFRMLKCVLAHKSKIGKEKPLGQGQLIVVPTCKHHRDTCILGVCMGEFLSIICRNVIISIECIFLKFYLIVKVRTERTFLV